MREMLNKYGFLITCLFVSFGVVAQGGPSPPHGLECCVDLEPEFGEEPSPEYLACQANPVAYCTVPIDNSIYIYISMATGLVLASFVIVRRIKRKKTPM